MRTWIAVIAMLILSCSKKDGKVYRAKLVPAAISAEAGLNYVTEHSREFSRDAGSLVGDTLIFRDSCGMPAAYGFNLEGGGFIITAAEAAHEPLLCWVPEGAIQTDTIPPGLMNWLYATLENITMIRLGLVDNAERAARSWSRWLKESSSITFMSRYWPDIQPSGCGDHYQVSRRGPLLTTTWGQRCSYNEACPALPCARSCFANQHAFTGCLATAVSQLIYHWRRPLQYDYTSMLVHAGNTEVQRLMRDAGKALQMQYGCAGSEAYVERVPTALQFGFSWQAPVVGAFDGDALLRVVNELNALRPLMLAGCSREKRFLFWSLRSDCHAWIADGYDMVQTNCYSYVLLHMNWGWHETDGRPDYNGWFAYNNWNPAGRRYRYGERMVTGLRP